MERIFVLTHMLFDHVDEPIIELYTAEAAANARFDAILAEHVNLNHEMGGPAETRHRANSHATLFVRYEPYELGADPEDQAENQKFQAAVKAAYVEGYYSGLETGDPQEWPARVESTPSCWEFSQAYKESQGSIIKE